MPTDKEIDRLINKAQLANEQIAWAKEEIDLHLKEMQLSRLRIKKIEKNIRGKQRILKIIDDFDTELEQEFLSIYGDNHA